MNTRPSHDGSLLWSLQSLKLLKLSKFRQLKSKCCCKLGINSDHWPRMTVWSYSTWEMGQMALKSHSGVFCKLGSPCLGHSKIYVVFSLKGQASVSPISTTQTHTTLLEQLRCRTRHAMQGQARIGTTSCQLCGFSHSGAYMNHHGDDRKRCINQPKL